MLPSTKVVAHNGKLTMHCFDRFVDAKDVDADVEDENIVQAKSA